MLQFNLNPELTHKQRKVISTYLVKHGRLSASDWLVALRAFDLLGKSTVTLAGRTETFADIYRRLVEQVHADRFIKQLLGLTGDIRVEGERLKALVARNISHDVAESGLYQRSRTQSVYLLAYLYYWWDSFARGYIFEVEILRDLAAAGVEFIAHDISQPIERRSPVDLMVLGRAGDIKTSTYFLAATRTSALRHDFYITRLWSAALRQRVIAVVMSEAAWQEINGDTMPGAIEQAADLFPQAVRIDYGDHVLVIASYEDWKARVKDRQQKEA